MSEPTALEKVQNLTNALNTAIVQRAALDDQIQTLRNTINGIQLGIEAQKEAAAKEE